MRKPLLVIACGALAREITALKRAYRWQHLDLTCIDARLHNRPEQIAGVLRERIEQYREEYEQLFVAYADCGSGGAIDKVLAETGIERLPGAHCYQFFAGADRFAALSEREPGTLYLTDFLAQHFWRLVVKPLKLDLYPELLETVFGNYRRLVYLAQVDDDRYLSMAESAAAYLGLDFERVQCGYGLLESRLNAAMTTVEHGKADTRVLA